MALSQARPSTSAVVAMGLLTAVHLARSLTPGSPMYVDALHTVAATLAASTWLKLYRDNCFESRLAAVLIAVASGLGALLVCTVGVPGRSAAVVKGDHVLLVLLGAAVPLLVLRDRRLCRRTAQRRPYAS